MAIQLQIILTTAPATLEHQDLTKVKEKLRLLEESAAIVLRRFSREWLLNTKYAVTYLKETIF